MPIYQSLHFRSQVTEVRSEEDLIRVLKDLKKSITLENYRGSFKDAVISARDSNKIVIPRREKELPKEIDVSSAVEQMRQYELARRKLCGHCENFVQKYENIEREQYCKLDRTRKLPFGNECQEGFKNATLTDENPRPLDEILEEI